MQLILHLEIMWTMIGTTGFVQTITKPTKIDNDRKLKSLFCPQNTISKDSTKVLQRLKIHNNLKVLLIAPARWRQRKRHCCERQTTWRNDEAEAVTGRRASPYAWIGLRDARRIAIEERKPGDNGCLKYRCKNKSCMTAIRDWESAPGESYVIMLRVTDRVTATPWEEMLSENDWVKSGVDRTDEKILHFKLLICCRERELRCRMRTKPQLT